MDSRERTGAPWWKTTTCKFSFCSIVVRIRCAAASPTRHCLYSCIILEIPSPPAHYINISHSPRTLHSFIIAHGLQPHRHSTHRIYSFIAHHQHHHFCCTSISISIIVIYAMLRVFFPWPNFFFPLSTTKSQRTGDCIRQKHIN